MTTYRSGPYEVEQQGDHSFVIPRQGGMRTEGLIYSDPALFARSVKDGCPVQVANVAHLPGIVGPALAMPDIHAGYGFPIGGVAAFDAEEGIVSPGGVGYDINCGVRLLNSRLDREDLRGLEEKLLDGLFNAVPAGVGSERSDLSIGKKTFESCMVSGAAGAVEAGFGDRDDLARIEGGGRLAGADPAKVSPRALKRGASQLGTLGSGNHFVEVGCVDTVYDEEAAAAFGLVRGRVTVMVHTGSRGFGHQVCDDAVRALKSAPAFTKLALPDRQLCCTPIRSPAGEAYLAAMAAAANYAFANRQIITHTVREAFNRALRGGGRDRRLELVYDLAHNIAKFEEHVVDGAMRRLLVHRKGATRAFPPGHPDLTVEAFRRHGQPVILPGDMGRYSYVLAGRREGGERTFFSSAHGAGRVMSRSQAKTTTVAAKVLKELSARGVSIRAASKGTIVEESPDAYKDVAAVAEVLRRARIAEPVARLTPFLVVKG